MRVESEELGHVFLRTIDIEYLLVLAMGVSPHLLFRKYDGVGRAVKVEDYFVWGAMSIARRKDFIPIWVFRVWRRGRVMALVLVDQQVSNSFEECPSLGVNMTLLVYSTCVRVSIVTIVVSDEGLLVIFESWSISFCIYCTLGSKITIWSWWTLD